MPKRVLQGTVVSDVNEKTVVVRVDRAFTHPVLKKTVRRSKKYHAHDEANAAKVGTATVDRVLNGRDKVSAATRTKVMDALSRLTKGEAFPKAPDNPKIAFLADSGISFNASLEQAAKRYGEAHPEIEVDFEGVHTADFDATVFARTIERAAEISGKGMMARNSFIHSTQRGSTLRNMSPRRAASSAP